MRSMQRFFGIGLAAALFTLTGCKSNSANSEQTPQQQSAMQQQTQPMTGANAGQSNGLPCPEGQQLMSDGTCSGSQPAQNEAPAQAPAATPPPLGAGAPPPAETPAPAQSAAAEPPPAAPAPTTLPVGARIPVRLRATLTTRDTEDGQAFSGTVVRAVTVRGTELLHAGDRVSGVVVESKSPGKFKGEGVLSIRLTNAGGMAVRTSTYTVVVKGKGKRTAGVIGGTAVGGAILGGIFGGGKGAAIGALAGGGAGTAAAAGTGNKEVEIPAESVITFRVR